MDTNLPINYSLTVNKAIDDCLRSTDPLDSTEFDPVGYVNDMFPNEESISLLKPSIKDLGTRMEILDGHILDAVKKQSTQIHFAKTEIKEVMESTQLLHSKIRDIKVSFCF